MFGHALNLLHDKAIRAWTLDELAKDVGLSCTSFASGSPRHPACNTCRNGDASWRHRGFRRVPPAFATISAAIGQGSEAAFIRAFKKTGGPPDGGA